MNKHTKITLQELIRRKEQMLESKAKPKTGTLYIKSLDGTITIEGQRRLWRRSHRTWRTVMRTLYIPVLLTLV